MRPYPLTVLAGGINRLRVKGAAAANQLYDLVNGYINQGGGINQREGTIRSATLDTTTKGLMAQNGIFNVFSTTFVSVPTGYADNVLVNPVDPTQTLTKIWFAKPYMGFPYVVAQFADGSIFDYWLQSNGTWTANTVYMTDNIVLPVTPNGLAYQAVRDFPAQPTWSAESTVEIGAIVEPTAYTGYAYKAVGVASIAGATNVLVPPTCLLHMDSVGSTLFTDSSASALVVTNVAGTGAQVVQSATNPKFAPGEGTFALNNTLQMPLVAGGPLDLQGDYTVDGWFNVPSLTPVGGGGFQGIWGIFATSATTYMRVQLISTGSLVLQCVSATNTGNSVSAATPTSAVSINTWHHFAAVRKGASFYIFLDGQLLGAGAVVVGNASPFGTFTGNLFYLGGDALSALQGTFFTGMQDEFRVTNGTALWTANFTPPSAPTVIATAHTGQTEPVWPTTSGGIIQEFGDFDTSSTDAGTTQADTDTTTSAPLGANITDRYGNSNDIAEVGTSGGDVTTTTTASTIVTTWMPGTLYATGAVVQPSTGQGAFINAIPNGDFENGDDGSWVFTGSTHWGYSSSGTYQGVECLAFPTGSTAGSEAVMFNFGTVSPGQSVTASAYLNPNNSGANLDLWVTLRWYDSTDTFISEVLSTAQQGGGYRLTTVTASAPPTAAHVRVAVRAGSGTNSRNTGFADLVSWNLETPAAISNFLYEAVQSNAASSGTVEPSWPTTDGATVIDGGVTWKAIGTSIITWQAIPLMESGTTEPTWPTTIGNTVYDPSTFTDQLGVSNNTSMSWIAIDRHIGDVNHPNTIPTALGASHVFKGDKDITPYSAAVDPTDWTSTNNAGYLPTGLNNYGDNPVAMLALYRSNLMVFNAGGYQMWQIDPDPANMALLDAQPVGSIYPLAAQSVANDLLFLTEVGVRNLGTVGATANMQIGATGQPVDPLVKAQLQAGTYQPISLYYPGRGQYWLIFGRQAFVLTINGNSQKTWARYIFPDTITDWTLNAGVLYLRSAGNLVWQLDANTLVDDFGTGFGNVVFPGVVQWPYLDAGPIGLNKMLVGVDLVGDGDVAVQLAFNQADKTTFSDNANFAASKNVTAPYNIAIADTVPGEPLPIPINAPSFSLVLTFEGGQQWSWEAANLYVNDAAGAGVTG